MKEYTNKSIEECITDACLELGVTEDKLLYKVVEEKRGVFSKKATIVVFTIEDAAAYGEEYLQKIIGAMGIEVTTSSTIEDGIIHISVDSKRNPVLIGKAGRTLQALNELARLAISNHFRHRYRVLVDAGGYKEDKYSRIAYLAKRAADEVIRTKYPVQLDPMTPDERRIVHNTLTGREHIKTESSGEGNERAVNIFYVE